jgi:hypothetical protein
MAAPTAPVNPNARFLSFIVYLADSLAQNNFRLYHFFGVVVIADRYQFARWGRHTDLLAFGERSREITCGHSIESFRHAIFAKYEFRKMLDGLFDGSKVCFTHLVQPGRLVDRKPARSRAPQGCQMCTHADLASDLFGERANVRSG